MVEGPEIPHHHHAKTGVSWFDLLVPIAVICISVAALLTSLQSEKSMRSLVEENRRLVSAQSTPLLMLDSSNLTDGKEALSMTLSNVGTGPARIAWFHLHDDAGNDDRGGPLYERLSKLDPHASFESQQISATYLRGGDKRLVFKWPRTTGNEAVQAAWSQMNKDRFTLHASACYCSIFNECRITEFGDSQPRMVDSCEQSK
jgi:hypothetical protein